MSLDSAREEQAQFEDTRRVTRHECGHPTPVSGPGGSAPKA